MEHNGWSDIAYSFGMCPHGVRYVGRGWDKNQFAGGEDQIPDDLLVKDPEWYSVLCFLGGPEKPTQAMLDGLAALIQESRDTGRAGLRVISHNTFRIKPCPGPELTLWAVRVDGVPIGVEADDMTPAELAHALGVGAPDLDGVIRVEVNGSRRLPLGVILAYVYDEIQRPDLLAARIDALVSDEAIEAAIAASGPIYDTAPTVAAVKQALKDALKEGTE